MQRFLFFAAILMIALTSVDILDAAPADAESGSKAEFALEVFPHRSGAVEFRDTWGERRSGGRRHRGTDILSPRGTPIVAVADGIVTFIGRQRLSGYTIKIDHANGWSSAYLHLNNDEPGTDNGQGGELAAFAPGLYEGAFVEAGQLIGWVGDSGNAEHTTPHTHFELKHNGEKLNPYPYLKAAWSRSTRDASGLAVEFIPL